MKSPSLIPYAEFGNSPTEVCEVGPLSCYKELADLAVSRDNRAAYLNDVHVISREVELAIGLVDEFGDEILFDPAPMCALAGRTEIFRTRFSSCVDNTALHRRLH